MKKLIKLDFDNTTRERKTENSYSELYSHDKNNGSFEFEILNDTLTTEQVIALFKFTESNKIWKTTGTVEGNKVKVTFDTSLITQNETVICYLYFDEEQRTSDTFRFKFKVKVSEIDKMNRYEVKERFINNTVIVDRLDVVTKTELQEALKNVGGIATEGLLTEVKAEEIYAKKTDAVDNTNFELVKNRVLALELKTDKDTVYDDSELKGRISVLEAKEDNNTIYDDTNVRERLTALESKPNVDVNNLVTKDELASKNYLTEHQDTSNFALKSEIPQQYNDTEVKERLTTLENKASVDLSNYVTKEEFTNSIPFPLYETYSTDTLKETLEENVYLTSPENVARNAGKIYVNESAHAVKVFKGDIANKKTVDLDVVMYSVANSLPDGYTLSDVEDDINNKVLFLSNKNFSEVVPKEDLKAIIKEFGGTESTGSNIDTSNLATKEELAKVVTKDELASKNYLTEHQPLTEVNNRLDLLEAKQDKDTVYNDEPIKERLTALENKPNVDLSNYVTSEQLENKHYLTQHQPLDNLVTKEELNSKGYVTDEVLNSKGYLTEHQNISHLVTNDELTSKGYITEEVLNSKNYLTEDVLGTKNYLTQHQDLSSLVTKQELENKHYLTEHQTLTHLATTSDLEVLRNISVNKAELSKKLDTTEFNTFKDNVVTKSELAEKGYISDLSNYVTKQELHEATEIDYSNIVTTDELEPYAKKSELPQPYNDSALVSRVSALESKQDKDTVYNDTEVKQRLTALENKPTNQWEIHGTGMPNGVVEAEIGTTYVDKNKTNGALKWIKTTAGGNQGWEVLIGDTGWRTLNSISKLKVGDKTSYIKIRRVNNLVTYQFGGLMWGWFGIIRRNGPGYAKHNSSGDKGAKVLYPGGIPEGFRSETSLVGPTYDDKGRPYGIWYLGGKTDSNFIQFTFNEDIPTDRDIGDIRVSAISYLTEEPWPTQLP